MSYQGEGFQVWRQTLPVNLVEALRVRAYELHEGHFGDFGAFNNWHLKHVLSRIDFDPALLPIADVFGSGTKLAVTHSKFSYKAVGSNAVWLPHQDAAYKTEPRVGATFAIPLEDVNASNGALEIGPRLPLQKHEAVGDQWRAIDAPSTAPIAMAQGDAMAFSLYTIHRSMPNLSHGLRAFLFIEFEPYNPTLTDDIDGPPMVVYA